MRIAALVLLPWLLCHCDKAEDGERMRHMLNEPGSYGARVERACKEGRAASCTAVGVQHAFGTYGRTKDYAAALPYLAKGCRQGDPYGCKELGVMHMYGRGTPVDHRRAHKLFEQACSGGVANGCHHLGDAHRLGRGVSKDAAKARGWYAKACKAGSKSSCPLAAPK